MAHSAILASLNQLRFSLTDLVVLHSSLTRGKGRFFESQTERIMANTAGQSAEWRGDRLLIFNGFFIPFQFICVGMRYLARQLTETPWGLDDILVFVSLVLQMALATLFIGEYLSSCTLEHEMRRYAEDTQAPSSLPGLAII